MTTARFLPPHPGAQARLAAALGAVSKPGYHREFLPVPFLLLIVVAVVVAAVAYLIWRGQQRRETNPGERHRDQR
jgi:hypothetical protein